MTDGKILSDSQDGFTLVEVLVSLALVSILATIIVLATSQFGALLRADNRAGERLALQNTVLHVAKLLEQAEQFPILAGNDPLQRAMLAGEAGEVRFIATARLGALQHGLREIRLRLVREDGRLALVQDMTPRRMGESSIEMMDRIELKDDIADLKFRYFGRLNNESPEWQSNWTDPDELPQAIMITIEGNGPGPRTEVTEIAFLGRR